MSGSGKGTCGPTSCSLLQRLPSPANPWARPSVRGSRSTTRPVLFRTCLVCESRWPTGPSGEHALRSSFSSCTCSCRGCVSASSPTGCVPPSSFSTPSLCGPTRSCRAWCRTSCSSWGWPLAVLLCGLAEGRLGLLFLRGIVAVLASNRRSRGPGGGALAFAVGPVEATPSLVAPACIRRSRCNRGRALSCDPKDHGTVLHPLRAEGSPGHGPGADSIPAGEFRGSRQPRAPARGAVAYAGRDPRAPHLAPDPRRWWVCTYGPAGVLGQPAARRGHRRPAAGDQP